MNLVLLSAADVVAGGGAHPAAEGAEEVGADQSIVVRLTDERAVYVTEVHRAEPGRTLRVGFREGRCGEGQVIEVRDATARTGGTPEVLLEVTLTQAPPTKLPLRVILALPRPKVLDRALIALTSLGVAEIVLVNAWRVDKSYWNSPKLADRALDAAVVDGLVQARDTVAPKLVVARLFRRYLEDELPAADDEGPRWVAHPGAELPCPRGPRVTKLATLAVGPEGGWIAPELASFARAGFNEVGLGPRVLRVETALAALIGRLF